jgi:hypothetical protein
LPAGLRGSDGTESLLPLRDKPALPVGQVKAEVFGSVLSNLGLFPRDFVSCLPQKRKEVISFHTVLLCWSKQQKFMYILEECAAMLVG